MGHTERQQLGDDVFRRLVEQSREYAIFTMDLEGRVTSWNEGAAQILGWSKGEVIGMSAEVIFTPEDRDAGVPQREMAIAQATGRAMDDRWHVRKDGSHFWTNGVMTPIRDDAGRCIALAKVLRDNTDLKAIEEALRSSRARMARLLESITDAFFALDRSWRFTYVNREAERVLERDREDLLGKVVWEVFPEAVGTAFDHEYHRAMREGVTVEFLDYYPPLERWLEVRVYPLPDGLAVFFIDTTQRRALEEEHRKLELERALNSQLMEERGRIGRELHDSIRQELLAIQMLSTSLHRKLVKSGFSEADVMGDFATLVGDANLALRQLIHDLVPPKVDAAYLPGALERVARNIERAHGVVCNLVAPAVVSIEDDETAGHLYYIAREAMTNAAQHSGASRIEVELGVTDESVVLQVRDAGRGLPDDYDRRGSMGVASMRDRANLIDADLSITSGPQAGTTVRCVVPRHDR